MEIESCGGGVASLCYERTQRPAGYLQQVPPYYDILDEFRCTQASRCHQLTIRQYYKGYLPEGEGEGEGEGVLELALHWTPLKGHTTV